MKKNYKLVSYKLLIALVIIIFTGGLIFGFDKGDIFLFVIGLIICYLVYKIPETE